MLWRVLVAATLANEVLRLDVVGLPGAAYAQRYGPGAVLLCAIVQQHVLRTETYIAVKYGATPNPPGISSGLQREAPPRIVQSGYRTMFRSGSFPS